MNQIFSPWGALLPGIDARFDVAAVEELESGLRRFVADSTSAWFPLANAVSVLQGLETFDGRGQCSKLWGDCQKPIGQSLQSMRRLASADALLQWSETLLTQPIHFISYRVCDGTQAAFTKTQALVESGHAVFWDRWCLPRRLAERREVVDDSALDHYLMDQLGLAAIVWGIESAGYFVEHSYAAKEKADAVRLEKYQPVASLALIANEATQCKRPAIPSLSWGQTKS